MNWRKRINDLINGPGPDMVFQPIHRLDDGARVGFEALARFPESISPEEMEVMHGPGWKNNSYTGMGPDIWFSQANLLGLGVDLEVSALCNALGSVDKLPDDHYIAVNIGPEALTSGALSRAVRDVDMSRVVVELTEHMAITDYPAIRKAVQSLQKEHSAMVCTKIPGIAADDVGAGSASLMHLLELGDLLTFCKLDISLTRGIDEDLGRQALAAGLVSMSSVYQYKIVAEGIEREEQLDILRIIGVYSGQGWLLGKPGPLPEGEL